MECMTCLYFPTKLWPFFSYTRVTSANFKLSENPLVSNVSEFHMFWGITSKTSEELFKKLMGLLSNIPDFLEFKFKNSWLISFSVTLLNINCFHTFIITRVIFTEHYSSIDRIFFTRLLGVKFISGPTLFSNSCTPKSSFLFSKKLLKRFCRFLIIRENTMSVFERYFRSDSTLITDKRFHSCPN